MRLVILYSVMLEFVEKFRYLDRSLGAWVESLRQQLFLTLISLEL